MTGLPNDFFNCGLTNVKKVDDKRKNLWGIEPPDDNKMISRLGFFPTSVWEPDAKITKTLKDVINDCCQTRDIVSGNVIKNAGHASVFNPHLAQMILSAYCEPNSKIYDPFAGGGTRGYIATKMGHTYVGCELRQQEVDRIKSMMNAWGIQFDIVCNDSTKFIPDGKFDFCFTCPPYYDLEVYSKMENDLSNLKSYDDYLDLMQNVFKNCYCVLNSGSFAIVVIGNIRDKNGYLLHLNGDLINRARNVGFKLWDELIWHGAPNVALTRCGNFEKNRKSIRVHEYVLVFKKD